MMPYPAKTRSAVTSSPAEPARGVKMTSSPYFNGAPSIESSQPAGWTVMPMNGTDWNQVPSSPAGS
ncbi:MAG: hypothetical protein ABR567_19705 [Myxococcales bacterium]|nr:hypothetical protein [Myxococcales bacterium]